MVCRYTYDRSALNVNTFVGAVVQLTVVWNLADLLNGLMAIPNLVSLLALAGVVVAETRKWRIEKS